MEKNWIKQILKLIPWPKFLELREMINYLESINIFKRSLTDFECLLSIENLSLKNILSRIYKLLIVMDNLDIQKFQIQWQEDLGLELTKEHWGKIWDSPANRFSIFNVRNQILKLVTCWYYTPLQLYGMELWLTRHVGDVIKLDHTFIAGGSIGRLKNIGKRC